MVYAGASFEKKSNYRKDTNLDLGSTKHVL